MSHPELTVAREDGLLVLTLNRPQKHNAFSFEMLERLEAELEKASLDDAVRAVILTGAGQAAFSAGMDLALLFEHVSSSPTGPQLRKVQHELQTLFSVLERLEKPTIAAIEGHCVGGGFELALACDLRVASSAASFGFPEAKLGVLPDLGGTTRLTRLVGPAIAKEWIFTCRTYPSVRALELGLINELVVPGDALSRARHLAKEILANGPLAIAWAKRIIDRGYGMSLEDSMLLEQYAMSEILPSAEVKEGIAAFLEKRAPQFR
ncbi:MAG: enoyl-CoA hydratase/isomerase family protein [Myxococcota bacterium]